MLGHADLKSTEIYTQVSIKALKAVHTATHPAKPIGEADNFQPAGDGDPDAAALLEQLDREAAEESAGL
jgi:integrase/recombinase XerD